MLGPRWKPPSVDRYFRRRGLAPLVRSTRNQMEIDYLPPYGDPEVSIPGEVATYLALGVTTAEVLDRLGE